MDMDRPHFRTTTTTTTTPTAATSELFICFTSRLSSSSSMKLSKSILSPGRAARDSGPGPVSLSSSLSRRLRTNGSLKGGQASPFFTTTTTTTGKKRGCTFENPEPSSPKVTCIGQVRVKTKKKVKQTRSLSRRRSGEVSFRKIEQGSCGEEENRRNYPPPQDRNQRWVHLPVSICEALRTFGAEFNCLFPCKSSCFSTGEREKGEEKQTGSTGNENGGCGAVFARWLVSVNDGEGGKRREIELVVGGGDEEEKRISMRSSRRHVFEDIEVKDDRIEVKGQSLEREEEAARMSICIPPKNALLLMRCRSDPMKMADLAHRFSWDARAAAAENDDKERIPEEEDAADEDKEKNAEEQVPVELGQSEIRDGPVEESIEEADILEGGEAATEMERGSEEDETQAAEELVISSEEIVELEEDLHQESVEYENKAFARGVEEGEDVEVESNMSSFEALLDQENVEEQYQDCPLQDDDEQVQQHPPIYQSPQSSDEEIESTQPLQEDDELAIEKQNEKTEENQTTIAEDDDKDSTFVNNDAEQLEESDNGEESDSEEEEGEGGEQSGMPPPPPAEPELDNPDNPEYAANAQVIKKERGNPVLPECLLLMMCEPKLSMEVSKETWVCSTDFVRWLPERPRKSSKAGGCDHGPVKRRLSMDSKAKPNSNGQAAPPRSSCSSMATMIEQKLVNAVGYEPFVLTRCKSEPMRTAAAKLMPIAESCCWKNSMRKLEGHRRAAMGVGGAAGVGF